MGRRCTLFGILALAASLAWRQGINTEVNRNEWEEINFDFDSSVLADGFPSLLRLSELLQANPGIVFISKATPTALAVPHTTKP